METQTKPTGNTSQKSVKETGYSQPEKEMRTPFGYLTIVISVAVPMTMKKLKANIAHITAS